MSIRAVSASGERTFSTAQPNKTCLRAKMNQERFNSVSVLNTHKDRTDKIDIIAIVTALFVTKIDFVILENSRKMILYEYYYYMWTNGFANFVKSFNISYGTSCIIFTQDYSTPPPPPPPPTPRSLKNIYVILTKKNQCIWFDLSEGISMVWFVGNGFIGNCEWRCV